MNQPNDPNFIHDDGLPKDAMSQRLRKLSTMPVDITRLERAVRAEVLASAHTQTHLTQKTWFIGLLTPLRAMAASVALSAIVATIILVLSANGPAVASAKELAEVYRTAVAGEGHSTAVSSVAEARDALRKKWSAVPEVPEPAEMRAMSCCVHAVGREQLACVTFVVDDQPVTLAFASAKSLCSMEGPAVRLNGINYVTGSADGINMVMNERDGTWMCLMGRLPVERLAVLSESLRK